MAILCDAPTCDNVARFTCEDYCGESYCSAACREEASGFHDPLCNKMADFDTANSRPSQHFRAVVFDRTAEFRWISGENGLDLPIDQHIPLHVTNTVDIQHDYGFSPAVELPRNMTIRVRYTTEKGQQDLDINECLSPTFPGMYWRGPVLAYGLQTLQDGTSRRFTDLNVSSIRTIGNFIKRYFNEQPVPNPHQSIQWVQAVKCPSTEPGEAVHLEEVRLPIHHPIFHEGMADISIITELVGIPLRFRKCLGEPGHNSWGPVFFRDFHPLSSTFGGWLPRWGEDCGSFFMVREDLKPLRAVDVRAFWYQICWKVGPAVERYLEETEKESKDALMVGIQNGIGPENFRQTWKETLMGEWEEASKRGEFYSYLDNIYDI